MMQLKKYVLGKLEKCYSVNAMNVEGKLKFFYASEAACNGLIFQAEKVKSDQITTETFHTPGGVMAMTPWPGTEGRFASVFGFYPPFLAEKSGLLLSETENSQIILQQPYLHRFEIIRSSGRNWLVLAVLCRERTSKNDWSSPGYVSVVPLDENGTILENERQILLDGQYHNHGMWKGLLNGEEVILTTSDQGVYSFTPADDLQGWKIEKLISESTGEAAVFDLDGDGEDELITIAPFHGSACSVYKQDAVSRWKKVWIYPESLEFAHSLWAGWFNGERVCFCGHRRGERQLLAIYWKDDAWKWSVIDQDAGSSNICVARVNGEDWLLSANHGLGECSVYMPDNKSDITNARGGE